MAVEITLPKLSDTMEEGKVLRWLKQVGDAVAAGDVIAEVETDKADMEVEAEAEGVLSEIRVPQGETAAVGAVLAVMKAGAGESAGESPKPAKKGSQAGASRRERAEPETESPESLPESEGDGAAAEGEPADRKSAEGKPAEGEAATDSGAEPRQEKRAPERPRGQERSDAPPARPRRVSPLAQRLARERGLDLAEVRGSGAEGKIVARDVDAPAPRPAREKPAIAPGRLELSKMRQSIARRMAEAKHGVPHFYVSAEIDMGEAVRLREALAARLDTKVSVSHLVVKATAMALVEHPRVNGQWDDGAVKIPDTVNIGLAVAVDDGLLVPVLHGCEQLSLPEIAAEARRLVQAARDGRFSGDDLKGGTFSISNLGMFDVDEFAAILNPPQAGILAVAAIQQRVIVRAGQISVAETMRVTLSCDHRQLNGVEAARFLETLKSVLEHPLQMVIQADGR
jgi:pyruvate dehydrogenase E2 component (dihydrolipoamide acetyltransferase)